MKENQASHWKKHPLLIMPHFNNYRERKSETFGGTLASHEVEREILRELKATSIKAMTNSVSKVEKASCCIAKCKTFFFTHLCQSYLLANCRTKFYSALLQKKFN